MPPNTHCASSDLRCPTPPKAACCAPRLDTLEFASLGDPLALMRRLLRDAPPPDRTTRHDTDEPVDDWYDHKMWFWGRGDDRVELTLRWHRFVYPHVTFARRFEREAWVGEEIDVETVLARIRHASGKAAPTRSGLCGRACEGEGRGGAGAREASSPARSVS